MSLTLSLGDMHAAGKIALMAQGSRPRLEAVLDFDTLDFRTGKKSTVTSAYSAKTWSEEAITFSDLGAIDADIQLSAKVLKRGELQAGATKLSAKLIAKKLDANMTSPDVAGGKLSTTLILDATSAVPKFDWKMQAEAVNAQILLKELFGFEALQGPVKFDADLQSAGVSQAEIISNLHGTAKLALTPFGKNHCTMALWQKPQQSPKVSHWQRHWARKPPPKYPAQPWRSTFAPTRRLATDALPTMAGCKNCPNHSPN